MPPEHVGSFTPANVSVGDSFPSTNRAAAHVWPTRSGTTWKASRACSVARRAPDEARLLRNSHQSNVQHHCVLVLDRPQQSAIGSVAKCALGELERCGRPERLSIHNDVRRESNRLYYAADRQMARDPILAPPV